MPLLSTRGAASARGFGAFSSLPVNYFFGAIGMGQNAQGSAFSVASANNNVYVVGYSNSALQMAAYDSAGVPLWYKTKGGAGGFAYSDIVVDSVGDIYVTSDITDTRRYMHLIKLNPSGSPIWQVRLGTTTDNTYSSGVCLTPTGVAVVGTTVDSSVRGFVASYDTFGTLLWQRGILAGTGYSGTYLNAVAADASGNIYAVGYANVTAGGARVFYVKYNSSGVIQWQYVLGGGTARAFGIALSSAGNIYLSGFSTARSGTSDFCIWRLNSSGTLSNLGASLGTNLFGNGIVIDSQDNVYVTGYDNNINGKIILAKLNVNLNWQWVNAVARSPTVTDSYGYKLCVDAQSNPCFAGSLSTDSSSAVNRYMFFGRVPPDGSKLGTYALSSNTIVYAGSGYTQYSLGDTPTATSGSDYSLGYTASAYSFTVSNGTLNNAVKVL